MSSEGGKWSCIDLLCRRLSNAIQDPFVLKKNLCLSEDIIVKHSGHVEGQGIKC